MRWEELLSDLRYGLETRLEGTSLEKERTEFERDYDRVIFSSAFRRLQNKTQIFPLPDKIFVHNRLTHSLEVSCVGRSLGSIVSRELEKRHSSLQKVPFSAISSIVSAACLAHDMGNPPFGHSGERAIAAYFIDGHGKSFRSEVLREGLRWADFENFEGNANVFRLLTHQFKGRRYGGFALTYSTLMSIVKYPHSSTLANKKGKFGFFQSEEDCYRKIAKKLGIISLQDDANGVSYVRYPLVYLVEAADDICYQIMDIEDACKLRILSVEESLGIMESFLLPQEKKEAHNVLRSISDLNEQVAYMRSRAINRLAIACAHAFLDLEEDILNGKDVRSLLYHCPDDIQKAYYNSSQIAKKRIYIARDVVDVELAGHRIFESLLDLTIKAMIRPQEAYSQVFLSRISSQYDTSSPSMYGKIQSALDYISGMTDIFALDLYKKLTGIGIGNS